MISLRAPRLLALLLAAAACVAGNAHAASPNNDIEWFGISHVAWQDRRPLCPVGGESFQVRVQSYRNDLTALRIRIVSPAPATIEAEVVGQRGPYDIWAAQVPATAANVESYFIEVVDGSDTDYYSTSGMSDNVPGAGLEFVLDFTTLVHAPLGATLSSGGTVFRVWAPSTATATVSGAFNSWGAGAAMVKTGEYFAAFVAGATDRQQYKFRFNGGSLWKPDARARQLNPSSSYNTYIENPFRYTWGDAGFVTPPIDQMVVYQLHVGTFSGGPGDPLGTPPFPSRYVDVANRVGHLKDLGVNAIQLNPVTEFPGDQSAGYNPITQWAPESKYGSPDDLRYMIDMLHRNGIAVLLDIVWNHVDASDNHLWQYDGSQMYFDNPDVQTPWGSQADFDKLPVRDYYANSALQWLEEYHVDGFRMDATSYMDIAPQAAAGYGLMQRFNNEIDNRWADKVAIAEELPDDPYITRPTASGGAGFDSQYHDAFTDNLRQEILDAGTGDPEMFRIANIINGSGLYLSNKSVLNYYELHDEAWPSNGGKRQVKWIDTTAPYDDVFAKGRSKLAQGLVLTAPGVPEILMGTEWLESIDFGTNAASRIDWGKKTTYAAIHAYYKKLIGLRRAIPALWANSPHHVFLTDEAQNLIAFRRWNGLKQLVVIANFSNSDRNGYRVGLPQGGNWNEVLNSQAVEYDGNGVGTPGAFTADAIASNGYAQSAVLNIPRMGLVIVAPAGVPLNVDDGGVAAPRVQLARISPSPARDGATVEFVLPRALHARLAVLDVSGREVAVLADRSFAAGTHAARWDGRDGSGARARAGVYFVRVSTADGSDSRKLALVP